MDILARSRDIRFLPWSLERFRLQCSASTDVNLWTDARSAFRGHSYSREVLQYHCERKLSPDMGRRRQLVVGLIMLIAGLVVVAVGTIFPSSNPLVALGWLLLAPLLVSVCGSIFVLVSLVRRRRTAAAYKILGSGAVAGLGLALGFGAAGILSQVPDSLAGLNGGFVPGSAPGLGALILGGIGLSIGLVIGSGTALIWWTSLRRHPVSEMSASR
jgi:hypothetical protein